jgi:hypothetical protein
MATIKDKDVLVALLRRMYWIEAEMEQLVTWEARIQFMGENVEALEHLSHDSDRHWNILQKWIARADIPVPVTVPAGLPVKIFNFNGMAPTRVFHEIMQYEILARDAYIDILNADPEVIKELFPDEMNRNEFIEDIKGLIKDEEEHRKICAKQSGGFKIINTT